MQTIKDERKLPNSSFGRGEDGANNPVAGTTKVPEERKPTTCGAVVCRSCSSTSSAHMFVVLLLLSVSVVFVLAIQLNGKIPTGRMFACVANRSVGVHVDDVGGHRNFSGLNKTTSSDISLGGLLPIMNDDGSCLSRFQSTIYRKISKHNPSSYLQYRLRSYEALHKICAPYTKLYNESIYQIKINGSTAGMACRYVVWVPHCGLGNRILSIASAFMYALLTNRVLLVKRAPEMVDLFCEPFPEGTWVLPKDFPYIDEFGSYYRRSSRSYGNMIRNKVIDDKINDTSTGPFHAPVVIYLAHDSSWEDQHFFNEHDQQFLDKFPLMVISSNLYFAPSLFTVPKFGDEMSRLFPERDIVFHHLGRYLFHPTNTVWGLITRYYQAYLAKANERIGIQIRNFREIPLQNVSNQIFSCLWHEEILPGVLDVQQQATSKARGGKLRAVLLTYLGSQHLEKMRSMYKEHPTTNGDIIDVHQPSHEEHQQTGNQSHNIKAWAEIYLLSLTDELVTSGSSTFGYVAQGLGGLEPWILLLRPSQKVPEPPCSKLTSSEPCNLTPPNDRRGSNAKRFSHIRTCEDNGAGIKLTNVAWYK